MALSNVEILDGVSVLGPKDITAFLLKNYGISTVNCAFRGVYGDTVGLFENDCNGGEDFYFVPTKQAGAVSTIDEVYMIPKDTVSEYKSKPIYDGKTFFKYQFNMREATQIYAKVPLVNLVTKVQPKQLPGDDLSYHELSARDRICIELKVPKTAHAWLNDLIVESQKIFRL
jgi:hypothetical protein